MKASHFIGSALLAAATFCSTAFAADAPYPAKTVQLIVPYPVGQGVDIIARIVAEELGKEWGQTVYIENRAGGASIPGMVAGRDAAPDGYTLTVTTVGATAINPALYPKLPYHPVNDFVLINGVYQVPLVILATPGSGIKTLKELVDAAKKKPGALSLGIAGTATIQHVSAEAWKVRAGVDVASILYKGSGQMITDMLGEHIPLGIDSLPAVLPHLKSGKLRALAVTTGKRAPQLADVPTVAESGYPGFEGIGWVGILAPHGTPAAVTDKVGVSLRKVLALPEVQKKIVDTGAVVDARGPKEWSAFVRQEIITLNETVQKAGIKVD